MNDSSGNEKVPDQSHAETNLDDVHFWEHLNRVFGRQEQQQQPMQATNVWQNMREEDWDGMMANNFTWEHLADCVEKNGRLEINGVLRLTVVEPPVFLDRLPPSKPLTFGDIDLSPHVGPGQTDTQFEAPALSHIHKIFSLYRNHRLPTVTVEKSPLFVRIHGPTISNIVFEEGRHGVAQRVMRVTLIRCRLSTSTCSSLRHATELGMRDTTLQDGGAALFTPMANGTSNIEKLTIYDGRYGALFGIRLKHLANAIRYSPRLVCLHIDLQSEQFPIAIAAASHSETLKEIRIRPLRSTSRKTHIQLFEELVLPLLRHANKIANIEFSACHQPLTDTNTLYNLFLALEHNTHIATLNYGSSATRALLWQQYIQPILDANLHRPKARIVAKAAAENGSAALLCKLLCHQHIRTNPNLIFEILRSNNEQIVYTE